ncbi:glycosyltransferase [Marinivivus vitaminiproducens]|uniref:glycosyltransferase n=1 Tax=Marinivivus vitaminiproducens TaxID=3035935 RepID=UPI00279B2C2E|nr:glycosyltransferase family 2 protein [Geminicoccaceae bacterium SCSIO 64248]
MTVLGWIVVVLASIPVTMTLLNWPLYRRLPRLAADSARPAVSLLIPARDEEATIGRLVASAQASRAVELEIVVLDDASTDRTAAIVRDLADDDPRIRLERAPPLPPGWVGKHFACHILASLARHARLVFVDADVVLAPDALGRIARALDGYDTDLLSGFPQQETRTLGEKLTVPNILVLLLGYLPMIGERFSNRPGFAAACGQLIAVRRLAYEAAGGHGAIRGNLHDGLRLPRAFRARGLRTRLFDASDLATCRMYHCFADAWQGFAKNATEGMATPVGLPIWSVLLAGGHILPVLAVTAALLAGPPYPVWPFAVTAVLYLWRIVLERRARGSLVAALIYPLGIAVTLAIQVHAFARRLRGHRPTWRGRSYPT